MANSCGLLVCSPTHSNYFSWVRWWQGHLVQLPITVLHINTFFLFMCNSKNILMEEKSQLEPNIADLHSNKSRDFHWSHIQSLH